MTGSVFTVELAHQSAAYVDPAAPSPIAVSFSVAYNVATALLTGGLEPADLAAPALAEAGRWRLAARIRVEHDAELTRRAVAATAPVGEALREAGADARGWLGEKGGPDAAALADSLGPPSADFRSARKAIGARVRVRLADGRELEEACDVPEGAAGSHSRERHAELMRRKLLRTNAPADVADALERIEELSAAQLADAIAASLTIERRSRAAV